jgi:hypothetical protein
MKTNILLLGAVVTAFAFTSFGAEPLLSPRAQASQIRIATSSDAPASTINSAITASPRGQVSQIAVIKGTVNESNPALICLKTMAGSPKVVDACSSNTTMPGCVKVASLK